MFPHRLLGVVVAVLSAVAHAAPTVSPNAPVDCPPNLNFPREGVKLTLVAEHPQVVTPIGIDVDRAGKVWVVSSNTHFRPDDYPGPPHDEIVVLSDFDPSGRAQTRTVFYDKTNATMGLKLGPDGWVYLSERSRILRVKDTDGDGRGDREETLITLETEETYPHNAMSGLAWHASGDLIFALGENMWKQWTLHGSDGFAMRGSGEGGIFRCRPDGSKVRRIAQGFWNPFGLCVRDDGEIFVGENDPGSRPPCRLLYIVDGGDYGYQRAYGEAPFHPFVCWNGDLRGTLPMICPSGEAPCGVQPLGGGLIGSSWTDHRIDFFPLRRRGASYTSDRIAIVTGGDMFRPTCITRVADGVYYFADWVFGSYPIHQRGRVWKLEIDAAKAGSWLTPATPEPPNAEAKQFAVLRANTNTADTERDFALARGSDPFLARAALLDLARDTNAWARAEDVAKLSPVDRASACVAIKLARPKDEAWARTFLSDADTGVQFEALRWISDERLTSFLREIEARLHQPDLDYRRFAACLAAMNALRDNARAGIDDPAMLSERVHDATVPARVRAFALRLLRPKAGQLTVPFLRELLGLKDDVLSLEVIRALPRAAGDATSTLAEIAGDETRLPRLRAEAIDGLAAAADRYLPLFVSLSSRADAAVREEALRGLRFTTLTEEQKGKLRDAAAKFPASADLVQAIFEPGVAATNRPALTELAAWQRMLAEEKSPPNPEAGQRIFFHPKLVQCFNCHQHSGRGNVVGPDLSAVGSREGDGWLLQAILEPSRDVAPQFYAASLQMKDGSVFIGIPLRDGGGPTAVFRDLTGAERNIKRGDVVRREDLTTSIMPPGLLALLTNREIRDLLAFLSQPTNHP